MQDSMYSKGLVEENPRRSPNVNAVSHVIELPANSRAFATANSSKRQVLGRGGPVDKYKPKQVSHSTMYTFMYIDMSAADLSERRARGNTLAMIRQIPSISHPCARHLTSHLPNPTKILVQGPGLLCRGCHTLESLRPLPSTKPLQKPSKTDASAKLCVKGGTCSPPPVDDDPFP